MQEMVSMGIGSKPFMDIKPSDAAISDRAIDYIMKGSGELFFYALCILASVCVYCFFSYLSDYPPVSSLLHLHDSPCNHADTQNFSLLKTKTWLLLTGVLTIVNQ